MEPIVISLEAGAGGKPAQVNFDGITDEISKAVDRISKLKRLENSSVLIRADAGVQHKELVQVIDVLNKLGARIVSMAVRSEAAEKK